MSMNPASCARSACSSSPMFAPAPRPKRLPVRMTPTSGVFAWAFTMSAVTARRSPTAACESVFIPPESKVTLAMPSRMSYVSCPMRPPSSKTAIPRRRRRMVQEAAPILATMLVGATLIGGPAADAATPIANGPPTSLPAYSGAPARPHRIHAPKPPHNPFLARNGRNNVHDDAWMSDTYWIDGPLGRAPKTLSTAISRVCVSVTFDRKRRLVATCSSITGAHLFMFDSVTLDALAELALPCRPPPPGQDPSTNSSGGAYFYLDDKDRAVVATASRHIWIVRETGGRTAPGFALEKDFDLTAVMGDDRITSV